MIVMSMAEEDLFDAPQIFVQGETIRNHRMAIARIKEKMAMVGFDES
jgi:alkyl hydroperoxide reductase subunit AhpF